MRLLSKEQIEKIHERSIKVLEKIGVNVDSKLARNIFSENNCRVEGRRVYFPGSLIEKLTKIKQKNIVIYSRSGKSVESCKGKIHIHNGGAVSTVTDSKTGKQREANLKDAADMVKLMDALDNIHAITPIVYPQEIEQKLALLYAVKEIIKNSSKPLQGPGVSSVIEVKYIYEMFLTLTGNEKKLREKPMFSVGCSPLSPLTLPKNDTEAMIWSVKKGIPIAALPCPTAGMTAPITILGALTQQNAEILAILTLVRLIDPSVPVSYSARLAYPDMHYGNLASGSPENGIVGACAVQLADYYGLESNVYGAGTSAFLADAQMGFEKAANILLPAIAGSNWLSGAGSMSNAITVSYEQLVIDNEIFGAVLHFLGSLEDDQEDLGFTAMQDVMNGDSKFLTHENTLKYLRSKELWNRTKSISNIRNYSSWFKDGCKSIVDNAKERVDKILKEHKIEPLDSNIDRELNRIIKAARGELLKTK